MRIFIFITVFLSTGCKNTEDRKSVNAPVVKKDPATQKNGDNRTVNPPKNNSQNIGKKIGEKDPLNCENICNHFLYCDRNSNSGKQQLRMCIRQCTYDKTETGLIKTEAFKLCLGKHRNSECKVLRKCINGELIKARKKLFGKEKAGK
ncbi:MAG: hypothetical protein JXR95_02445 [Deltaproteobacteria bacterium]|nr:hypothetical protein [Deltaproteobacteria bacterium]